MDALDVTGLLALGFAAGMAGGLLGVGGGVLFVPALVVFAHESQLGAVKARVLDAADPDQPADIGGGTSRDASDAGIAAREPAQQLRGLLRDLGVRGPLDDRRQRPVDVEEQRRARRVCGEGAKGLHNAP